MEVIEAVGEECCLSRRRFPRSFGYTVLNGPESLPLAVTRNEVPTTLSRGGTSGCGPPTINSMVKS